MKRRDVLGAGFLGAVGLGAGVAGATDAMPPEDLDRELRRIRKALEHADRLELELEVPGQAGERAELDAGLIRSSLRSLLLAGAVADLPQGNQQDPAVRELVDEMGPELDHAVDGMMIRLETLSDADRSYVEAAIRSDPAMVDRVAGELNGMAARAGASPTRQKHLRDLVEHAVWRMRHQPLGTVLEEVTGKAREQARLTMAAVGERPARGGGPTEWDRRTERIRAKYVPDIDTVAAQAEPVSKVTSARRYRLNAQELRRVAGHRALVGVGLGVTGAVLLGIGVSSEAMAAVAVVSLFVMTASVVLLIIALITMIIAAVRQAREDRELREE